MVFFARMIARVFDLVLYLLNCYVGVNFLAFTAFVNRMMGLLLAFCTISWLNVPPFPSHMLPKSSV